MTIEPLMHPKTRSFFAAISALLLVHIASAVSQDSSSTRTIRFAISDLPRGFNKTIFFLRPEGPVECPISFHRFSPERSLPPGQNELHLYKQRPTISEETRKYSEPDCIVQLPQSSRVLVVLFPDAKDESGKTTLGAHPIDEAKFPPGSIYFFNPTSIPVAAKLERDVFKIEGGVSRLFTAPNLEDGKPFGVQISLHQEEGWKLFASTRWHISPRERHLVFFKINPRTRKPDYDSLTDYLDDESSE